MDQKQNTLFKAVLSAGFIVGVMDAVAASVYSFGFSGSSPVKVFLFVASGIFGKEAYAGGLPIAACGLLFHFIVAMGWTALFFLVYPRINFFSSSKYIAGIIYGIFIWLMMNYVVVPLSNVPPFAIHFTIRTWVMILIHMFVIGVPIAYQANRYYSVAK